MTLTGSRKRDVLKGEDGRDRLDGRGGADLLEGKAGDDRLIGGGGNDALFGGRGDDHLRGGAGRDVLVAGAGDDRLSGGGGADALFGLAGADVLIGGRGADAFFFTHPGEVDRVADYERRDALLFTDFRGEEDFDGLRRKDLSLVYAGRWTEIQVDGEAAVRVRGEPTLDDIEIVRSQTRAAELLNLEL